MILTIASGWRSSFWIRTVLGEPMLEIFLDGNPIVQIDEDGKPTIDKSGCARARINGSLIDVDTATLRARFTRLNQVASAALANPFRDALNSAVEVHKNLPPKYRSTLRVVEVQAVLAAVIKVASSHVQ